MNISVNAITKEEYEIPVDLDDSKNIKEFLSRYPERKVIVVQGLGFVGAVMSIVCANSPQENYMVIGVDVANEDNYWKIRSLNDGIFPLLADDPKIDEYYTKSKKESNFYATYDPLAYGFADVIIVDINLDVKKDSSSHMELIDYSVDLSGFKKAIEMISLNCRADALILVETTVPPGTCENIVKPIIDNKLSERGLSVDQISIGHSYERVMPGPDYIDSISSFPRVYSGVDDKSAIRVESFLKTIIDTEKCELTRLESTNATEMAKVLENSYRAMNISFVVEWSRYAEEAGVDLFSIVDAIRSRSTHANLMYPGIGVGGYCLTKDPLLASWSKKSFFGSKSGLDMSTNSVSINDQMPVYAFERLIQIYGNIKDMNILFMGVSYRGDVGDTRYTPVETLYNLIKNETSEILLHDPFVSFWHEKKCNIASDLNKVITPKLDLIIISTGHSAYKKRNTIDKLMELPPVRIYDTIGIFTLDQISLLQKKHQISVLGRGDLFNGME